MNCKKELVEVLYGVLALSKEVDEEIYPILNTILKREKIQDCLEFLSKGLNLSQVKSEIQQLGQEQMVKITNTLNIINDHEFYEKNQSMDEQNIIEQEDYRISKISSSSYGFG